ncbi:NUDIX hydrolase [Candidatus Pacearchaeota archaeon]|nr:NUDIX hydrolase [Candidatus Pacearchaeota archaeon]
MIRRFLVHLLGIQSAVAGIIVRNGKVLLTRRSKLLAEGGKWCLPGGGINKWEKSIDAVKREVMEEVGLDARECKLLFVHEEIVKKLNLHANVSVYEIKYSGDIKTNWEVVEWGWFSRSEIVKMNLAFTHKDILNRYWGKK